MGHPLKMRARVSEEQKCTNCGTKLTDFIAYIPSLGKACMSCYIVAAQKEEANYGS